MRAAALALILTALATPAALAEEAPRDWSGPYLGAYAGLGLGDLKVKFDGIHPHSTSLDGFAGGGLAGWAFQSGALVVGIEADVGVTGQSGEVEGSVKLAAPDPYFYTDKFRKPWEAHLRLRAGWACGDLLLFAGGGLALAGMKFGYQSIYDQSYDWDRGTQLGWTAGGGLDYALDESFALRLEYSYDDFGERSYFQGRDDVALKTHTVRLAVTYGF